MPTPSRPDEGLVSIRVIPKSSRSRISIDSGGQIKVWVMAPPVDGAANKAVCELVAKTLGIARSKVEVVSGHLGRNKVVRAMGLSAQEVIERLGSA